LAEKTPANDNITWSADPSEKAEVVDYRLYTEALPDQWRTLTLCAEDAKRTVTFRSARNLMTPYIQTIKINGEFIQNTGTDFVHKLECGSPEVSVSLEITIGGFATSTSGNPVIIYANQPHDITITTSAGEFVKYTFTVEKPLSLDIFVQRWDDVLAVNNNYLTNGGYNFIEYEWRKDGVKMPAGDKGYIHEPGGLSATAEYTVVLTTQQGNKISTCPAKISGTSAKMSVYPNPVQRGQAIHVTPTSMPAQTEQAILQLFDATGNTVAKQIFNASVAEITAPDIPGAYILQITVNGAVETFKIMISD
jgi:hypothetical protein